jgi:hypothetical protein
VFYNKDGSPKSVDEVYKFFERKISDKAVAFNEQLGEKSTVAQSVQSTDVTNKVKTTSKASVAPSTESYEQVASKSNEIEVSPEDAPRNGAQQVLPVISGRIGGGVQTAATDVPFVLGDNHMVVINTGMLGA